MHVLLYFLAIPIGAGFIGGWATHKAYLRMAHKTAVRIRRIQRGR